MSKRKRPASESSSSQSSADGQAGGEAQTLETILRNHETAIATVWQKLKEIEEMLKAKSGTAPTVVIQVSGRVSIDPEGDERTERMGFRQGK